MTRPPPDPASVAAWVADRLDEESIPYAIGGALALAALGFPRTTADVDLSVFVPDGRTGALFDALERAGCLFSRDEARADLERLSLFSVRHGPVRVDLFVAFHALHHEALRRRVRLRCGDGVARWYIGAEDLAVLKLLLDRPKDVADLERLFAARGPRLDLAYVRRWLRALTGDHDPRLARLDDLEARFARPTRG